MNTGPIVLIVGGGIAAAGLGFALAGSKAQLLSATIRLRDIADFDQMNEAWDAWLDRAAMPVRATVEARPAGEGYRVEIMVVAARGVG